MAEQSYVDGTGTVYYDLTTTIGDEAEIDGSLFLTEAAEGSSGTGLIQAFVRTQATGSEAGYNTSERPLSYDENSSPQFTKSLLLNQVPVVVIDGVAYYEFRLDINQTNNDPLLSLNELKIYKSSTDAYSGEIDDPSFDGPTTLVWDLDDQNIDGTDDTDNTLLLDYSLQAGSGRSDMFFYVPVADFGGANPDTTYVVLYSEFGNSGTLDASDGGDIDPLLYGDYSSNDGFEEWSVSKELGDNFISGFKWLDTDGDGVWDEGELGLGGWKIDYTYTVGNGPDEHEVTGSITTSDGTTDYDGDGNLDEVGFYVIPVEFNHKDYTITLTEVSQDGWINTFDGDATADYVTTVLIDKDLENLPIGDFGETELLNFGNFQLFTISGHKYTDVTGDGLSGDDTGLGGVTVFIDVNGNGADDDGYSTVTSDGTTDANGDGNIDADDLGYWEITGLGPDVAGKEVKEITPTGYIQTVGQVGTVTDTNYVITGTSGADQGDLDFANFKLFDISGHKYTDITGDGLSGDDTGLGGVTVFIDVNGNGADDDGYSTVTSDGTTDANGDGNIDADDLGYWEITGLGPDVAGKEVKEITPTGYVQTVGQIGTVTDTTTSYTLGYTDQDDIDFANFELFDISGHKYTDITGDGLSGDDTGLGGVTVFIDVNGNGADDDGYSTVTSDGTTDANGDGNIDADDVGYWELTDLDATVAGAEVKEITPSGYIQTVGQIGIVTDTTTEYTLEGTSGADQNDIDFANFLPDPKIDLEKSVKTNLFDYLAEDGDDDPDGLLAGTGSTVTFKVVVTNTGNETLSGITLTDSVVHTVAGVPTLQDIVYTADGDSSTLDAFDVFVDLNNDTFEDPGEAWINFDTDGDGVIDAGSIAELSPNETFTLYYSLNAELGQHENTGRVDATSAISNSAVTDSDDANYYMVEEDCVGVRTPGFWSNPKWMTFWDAKGEGWGTPANEPKQAGSPGFADGELLYKVYLQDTNGDTVIDTDDTPSKGLLIGDYNLNGITDVGEDTLFISLSDAQKLINASSKQLVDGKTADGIYMLGRDMVTTWLNYLANNQESTGECIGDVSGATNSPREYLDAAIDWMQQFASTTNGTAAQNLLNSYHDGDAQALFQFDGRIAPGSASWQIAVAQGQDIPVSASEMHSQLDAYNNSGAINGIEYCCDADSQLALLALSQINLV